MTTLHIFMGSHGSTRNEVAKTFAKENGLPIIEADGVRKEYEKIENHLLFEEIYRRIKKTLQKEDLVFDATNLIAKQRKQLLMQLKAYDVQGYFIFDSVETCVEGDKISENPLGADFVVSRLLSTDLPFIEEGWGKLTYFVEELAQERMNIYNQRKKESLFEDEALQWVEVFLQEGKPYLEELQDRSSKRIGYNNLSAYLAFQFLYQQELPFSFIQEVVELILYRKRWTGANEKGKEKLQKALKEETFEKLLLLI